MAGRENRAANRKAAKEVSESDIDDLFASDISGEDEEDLAAKQSSENTDELEEANEEIKEENAAGSETEDKTGTPPAVKKEGEEEGKSKAEVVDQTKKVEEQPAGEATKPEEVTKPTEPVAKTEPVAAPAPAPKEEKKKEEPAKQLSNEEATQLFSDWRNETEGLLAEHHYKLKEKDIEEFNEAPEKFVAKMASRVYLDSVSAAFQQFTTYLPRLVDQVLEGRKTRDERANAFYSEWPELKEHHETVLRLGAAYRASNPDADAETFIKEVGAQAMVALRIPPRQSQQMQVPTTPTKPFAPATGNPASNPPRKQPSNPFEQMVEEFSLEDLPEN